MNNSIATIFCLSVSGSIFAVVLFLFQPITKKICSYTWHYYIWLVIILKLMIPVSPQVNFIQLISHTSDQEQTTDLESQEHVQKNNIPPQHNIEDTDNPDSEKENAHDDMDIVSGLADGTGIQSEQEKTFDALRFLYSRISQNAVTYIGSLYLLIVLALFVKKSVNYNAFIRIIRKDSRVIEDEEILEIYNETSVFL